MKKILFTITILAILLGMSNCKEDPQQAEKEKLPKIYKVIYNGNGNTQGEAPVDDNLYAEGDIIIPRFSGGLVKIGRFMQFYEVLGAKEIINPYLPQFNKFWADESSKIVIGNSDVELRAIYDMNEDLLYP